MKLKVRNLLCFILSAMTILIAAGCNNNGGKGTYYDNENDSLIFSTLEVDKVFNPFFNTSATDSNVVGMTQISMLGNDKNGNYVYGDNETVVTKDLQIITNGTKDVNQKTVYYFVLKNDIRFSNGSLLSIKDVLFNLYVYLDPAYTGSSTIYSTDIVGLKEYRTQEANELEQDNFKVQFQIIAETRINALIDAATEIIHDNSDKNWTKELFRTYLEEYVSISDNYKNVVADYDKTAEMFEEELEADYSNSLDSYESMVFTDRSNKIYSNLFTTDVECFLYNEGYISWNKKEGKLESSLTNEPTVLKSWSKEQAIATVFADKFPRAIGEILMYWNTSVTLNDYLVNAAMEEHFQSGATRKYKNITGIKFANHTAPVEVNGKTYAVPTYDDKGNVKSGNEVLGITINNVDPKAIWNFAFTVAPMYYYSDAEHIGAFDYEENFGVKYMSQTFMNNTIKNPDKIGVPVGAGPYAASKSSGGIENISSGDFYSLGIIYYERNPYFIKPAKIKKVRFKVVSAAQMLNSLYNQEIDFAEPNSKPETISELNSKKTQGIGNKPIQTAGYGYIGINAGKVPDIRVRQAIMHSINVQECVSYYKTTADPIYRSMSKSSWAYPKNSTPYYPYIGGAVPEDLSLVNPEYAEYVTGLGKTSGSFLTKAEQQAFVRQLVVGSGYTLNGNGVYQKGNNVLEYTFTIAGEENDHPAWNALFHAREILNEVGFQITVKTDSQALKKLASGDLTVWAAAWGSTIDPDMYQVYHKDSKATSVLNWGYKQILLNIGGKYDEELALIDELSELIDDGRKTNDKDQRARIYSKALDVVMQLAVELPTYQRDDLFAYNTNKIDVTSFTPEDQLSSFKGLTGDIYNVSLVVEK